VLKLLAATVGVSRILHLWSGAQYRTDDPRQRCRVVASGNPPTTAEGRWVIAEWAPWLDPQFPRPAQPGTLRWYTTLDDHLHWLESGESIWLPQSVR
jgi:hypothetical protein